MKKTRIILATLLPWAVIVSVSLLTTVTVGLWISTVLLAVIWFAAGVQAYLKESRDGA